MIYVALRFMRGTRGEGILKGLFFLLVGVFVTLRLAAQEIELRQLETILDKVLEVTVLALLIIFQPELRRALTRMTGSRWFPAFFKPELASFLDEVVEAAFRLAKNRVGAIIAIKREVGLGTYIEQGVSLDSEVSSELIETIFYPGTALHDGAIVIQDSRIAAAGCLFPLTDNPDVSKKLGTRHRAAIGVTEETDALAIVVSEETGAISLACDGVLDADLGKDQLSELLKQLFLRQEAELAEVAEDDSRKLPRVSRRLVP